MGTLSRPGAACWRRPPQAAARAAGGLTGGLGACDCAKEAAGAAAAATGAAGTALVASRVSRLTRAFLTFSINACVSKELVDVVVDADLAAAVRVVPARSGWP